MDMTVLKQNSVSETYPLHTHTFYEYFLVSKGRALHVVNNEIQVVERGSLVLIRPHDQHCYNYYQSQDFEFYNVGITLKQFDDVNLFFDGALEPLNQLPLPGHVLLEEASIRQLEEHIIELKNQTPGKQRNQLKQMLLSMVAYYILNNQKEQKTSRVPAWLVYVLNEFEKSENYIQGLPRLLELSHYSQEYINREFQRYFHTTPTRYINEKRLSYAKKLLEETSLTILEVCEQCGFHSISHFYTQYKKFFGYTPQSMRIAKYSS
jgi:AraC family cel operon transcriptional repressor